VQAVRRLVGNFGSGVMHALRHGVLPRGFELGGMVGAAQTALAVPSGRGRGAGTPSGGNGGVPRELGILRLKGDDGREHATFTDEDTALALTRVVRKSSNNSTMRRTPKWDRK